ncbi:MAG: hypothetical protein KIS67_14740 [Verrucomicrobiae bacterium]|nr:hypothetical protein [Verrucomicrobiae bacterium]
MIESQIKFRIHGDNIVECDRCLELIAQAFAAQARLIPSDPFRPAFEIVKDGSVLFGVDLIPGHGRWRIDLQQMLRDHGAPLREATDVILTKLSNDETTEQIVAALEFCSALPAGNNAWQRNGRALACAAVGIPYLYFAEVGGVELDARRVVKASRFPNPIVPFSYLTASRAYRVICLPVYAASPSSDAKIRADFASSFGVEIGQQLVRATIEGASHAQAEAELTSRALLMVQILSAGRKRVDTLRGDEWSEFLNQPSALEKAHWLERRNLSWTRKVSDKVRVSTTFPKLVKRLESASSLAVGAGAIPICLIPQSKCARLAKSLQQLYGNRLNADFVAWLALNKHPLVVVWVTGFKPRGDDSRPDRGLVPLARMLFGNEARILSVVSGPGKAEMWRAFQTNPAKLAMENGLWEAVINLSDAVLADSATLRGGPQTVLTNRDSRARNALVAFPTVVLPERFSEHDVDSVLHLLFSRFGDEKIFESMCNPPGGDWSGVTLRDGCAGTQYRWTSLPRVSGKDGKRPDHVIQISQSGKTAILAAIESKDTAGKLEDTVGRRLKRFMHDLLASPPTICRPPGREWTPYSGNPLKLVSEVISAGAFCWENQEKLERCLKHGNLDAAFALEFFSNEKATLLHLKTNANASFLVPIIREAAENFGGRLKVQIH